MPFTAAVLYRGGTRQTPCDTILAHYFIHNTTLMQFKHSALCWVLQKHIQQFITAFKLRIMSSEYVFRFYPYRFLSNKVISLQFFSLQNDTNVSSIPILSLKPATGQSVCTSPRVFSNTRTLTSSRFNQINIQQHRLISGCSSTPPRKWCGAS